MNLIECQRKAVDAILAAREQGPKASTYGYTFLNRNPRVLRGIRNTYDRAMRRWGFTPAQLLGQWEQIKEIATLEHLAEDE